MIGVGLLNIGYLFIILNMIVLGLSIPAGSVAMATIPVWLFTAMTLGIACMILLPAAKIYERIKWKGIGYKTYFGIFMQSLFTVTLYTVFLLYGLKYSSVIAAGIINSMVPAVTLVLSFILLGERLNIRKGIAIMLAVSAVLVMELAGASTEGESSALGIAFMILAVVSLGLFFVYAKKFAVDVPPVTMAAGLCLMGFLTTLPMAIHEAISFDWGKMTLGLWGAVIAYTLLGWVFAYIFTYLGISKVPASTIGMATAIIPITAMLYAVLFLGDKLRNVDIIATVLLILSIFIAESKESVKEGKESMPVVGKDDAVGK
ncbi:DMT family transporter [Peribacillus simplex]|uniref:DMT family transporter n=1 Tax=Peribacillus TaxID=2675229 RepID=UPI0036D9CE28